MMSLKTGHVEVGNEVNDPDSAGHEGDVIQLGAWPLDDLEKGFHHAAGDQSLASGLKGGQVVQKAEQGRGQRLWEGRW